jgi:hypothetical protein
MRDLIQWIAGQHIAIMLCGHNQPDMSGDQRNRLSDMRRRQCDNAARAITDQLLDDELPIARALALLDRVGDAAADALIKGEAEVFWSKEEAEASEVLTALRNAPPGPDVIPEHERFVSRARVWAIKNRAAMDALIKGEAAVVPVACTDAMRKAWWDADGLSDDHAANCDWTAMLAAGRLDKENDDA